MAKTSKKRRKTKDIDPFKATWEELVPTVPKKDWYAFRDLVLSADMTGKLDPKTLVEKHPDHPVVRLVLRFLETGNRRLINKALKAVAGTDDRYELVLLKS